MTDEQRALLDAYVEECARENHHFKKWCQLMEPVHAAFDDDPKYEEGEDDDRPEEETRRLMEEKAETDPEFNALKAVADYNFEHVFRPAQAVRNQARAAFHKAVGMRAADAIDEVLRDVFMIIENGRRIEALIEHNAPSVVIRNDATLLVNRIECFLADAEREKQRRRIAEAVKLAAEEPPDA